MQPDNEQQEVPTEEISGGISPQGERAVWEKIIQEQSKNPYMVKSIQKMKNQGYTIQTIIDKYGPLALEVLGIPYILEEGPDGNLSAKVNYDKNGNVVRPE